LGSVFRVQRGRRTSRFSTGSHRVLLSSSFLCLSIKQSRVSWLCSGVAIFVATGFFMAVLVASLLHDLACALLHEYLVFKTHCSSGLDRGYRTFLMRSQHSRFCYPRVTASPKTLAYAMRCSSISVHRILLTHYSHELDAFPFKHEDVYLFPLTGLPERPMNVIYL